MMFAISIWLITSQRLLLPSSSTDYVINASYDALSSCEEHNRFITFHRCTMHGLGSTSPPVGVSSASGELGTPEPPTYLLVKHLSIFRLFSITTFRSGSPALAIPCFAPLSSPLDASSCPVTSRLRDRPYGRGYIVPGALDSAW
jgi:hypothetical protein